MADEALATALAAQARKERTVAEMAELLKGSGIGDEEVERVVSFLVETETLDDAVFARRYAEDKRQLAGWGDERIRETLHRRGVGSAEIESALAGDAGPSETERAVTALRKRGRRLDDDGDRRRALGFLARRGYTSEVAYEAIRRATPD